MFSTQVKIAQIFHYFLHNLIVLCRGCPCNPRRLATPQTLVAQQAPVQIRANSFCTAGPPRRLTRSARRDQTILQSAFEPVIGAFMSSTIGCQRHLFMLVILDSAVHCNLVFDFLV